MSEKSEAEKVIGDLIWIDRDRTGGEPCIYGTRIPVTTIWDYLEGSEGLKGFFEGFDHVPRERVYGILELAKQGLLKDLTAA
jgi:uncharacterized protein (DUF433 family)